MVPLSIILRFLLFSPAFGVFGEEIPFIDRECRHSDACQAEVVGAGVDSSHGCTIRLDLKAKGGSGLLHHSIEAGALRTVDLHRGGYADGQQLIEVEVEAKVANGFRGM